MKKLNVIIITAMMAIILFATSNIQAAEVDYMKGHETFKETSEDIVPVGSACVWNIQTIEGVGYSASWRDGLCEKDKNGNNVHPGRYDFKCAIVNKSFAILLVFKEGKQWVIFNPPSSEEKIPIEYHEAMKNTEEQVKQSSETTKDILAMIDGDGDRTVMGQLIQVDENAEVREKREIRRDAVYACKDRVYSANTALQTAALQQQIAGANKAQACGKSTGRVTDYQIEGAENGWQVAGIAVAEILVNKKLCDPKAKPVEVKAHSPATCEKNPDYLK